MVLSPPGLNTSTSRRVDSGQKKGMYGGGELEVIMHEVTLWAAILAQVNIWTLPTGSLYL